MIDFDKTWVPDKEVFIHYSSVHKSDDGTNYYAINGFIDPIIKQLNFLNLKLRIRLGRGEFFTTGIRVKNYWIQGQGIYNTTIKLIDNCGSANFNYPHLRMIVDDNWCKTFIIKDLTLDGNWLGQKEAETHGNFKIEPLVVNCIRGKAERIKVINFGVNGLAYGELGLECFPLSLITFSNGDLGYYYDWAKLIKEETTFVEISNCEVSKPFQLNGGYCSAIFVQTNLLNAGDRQPYGTRTTQAALIRNNYVCVPNGIAYNACESEMVTFEGNVCVDSKCAFNTDTGPLSRVRFINNQFINVNQGINVCPTPSKSLVIERNTIVLTKPFYNPVLKRYEEFWGVRVRNVDETVVKDNCIVGPIGHPDLRVLDGVTDGGNIFVSTTPQSQTVGIVGVSQEEHDKVKSDLLNTQTTLSKTQSELSTLQEEFSKVRKDLTETKNDLSIANATTSVLKNAIKDVKDRLAPF